MTYHILVPDVNDFSASSLNPDLLVYVLDRGINMATKNVLYHVTRPHFNHVKLSQMLCGYELSIQQCPLSGRSVSLAVVYLGNDCGTSDLLHLQVLTRLLSTEAGFHHKSRQGANYKISR